MNGHITDTGIISTFGSFHQGDEYQFGEYSLVGNVLLIVLLQLHMPK